MFVGAIEIFFEDRKSVFNFVEFGTRIQCEDACKKVLAVLNKIRKLEKIEIAVLDLGDFSKPLLLKLEEKIGNPVLGS